MLVAKRNENISICTNPVFYHENAYVKQCTSHDDYFCSDLFLLVVRNILYPDIDDYLPICYCCIIIYMCVVRSGICHCIFYYMLLYWTRQWKRTTFVSQKCVIWYVKWKNSSSLHSVWKLTACLIVWMISIEYHRGSNNEETRFCAW